jgi:hypothetical protein
MYISAYIQRRKTFYSCRRHKKSILFLLVSFFYYGSAYAIELSSDLIERADLIKSNDKGLLYRSDLDGIVNTTAPRLVSLADSENYQKYGSVVVHGMLFTYKSQRARNVFLVTEKDQYARTKMEKNIHGVWYGLLILPEYDSSKPGRKIRYKYLVDDLFLHDPTHNNKIDDGSRGFISFTIVPERLMKPKVGVIILPTDGVYGSRVLFRIKLDNARNISLVGTFNNWNSELDVMKQDAEGYFYLEKYLESGDHLFAYKVDGERREALMPGNLRKHPVFGTVNLIEVP